MSNHTPGPWHAATADEWRTASGEHAQWGRFDISAGSNDPAAENYYRIASVSNVNNSEQNQANAKLIGAAPDMLLALRDHALAHHEEAFTSDAPTEALRAAASYAGRLGGDGSDSFTLGAFRGDRLVGAITCERDPRTKVRHIGHLVGTMVHADEMRRGVGGALRIPGHRIRGR